MNHNFLLFVKKLTPAARLPKRSSELAAGYDLFMPEDQLSLYIPPGDSQEFDIKIATAFRPGWVGLVQDRGSTGFKGAVRLAGVIDADYRGSWKVKLFNSGREPLLIQRGKAIAQVLFLQHGVVQVTEVEELTETVRGTGGFGSTDKRE